MKCQILKTLVFSLLGFQLVVGSVHAQPYTSDVTTRLSYGTFAGATEANAAVQNPKVSRNGRFVVFESTATNLVNTASGIYSGFSNINGANRQIYLYDRQAGNLELISINDAGTNAAPMDCYNPTVSSDGRYVSYVATTNGANAEIMNHRIDGNLGDGNDCLHESSCHINYWVDGTHIWVRDRFAHNNFVASQVDMPVKMQAKQNGLPKTQVVKRCATTGASCGSTNCDVATQVDTTIPVIEERTIHLAQGILTSISPLSISSASADNPYLSGDGRYLVYDSNSDYLAGVAPDSSEFPLVIEDPVCGVDYNVSLNNGLLDADYIGMPTGYYQDANDTVKDVFVRDGATFSNTLASYGCQYFATGRCFAQGANDAIKGSISDDGTQVVWQSTSPNLLPLYLYAGTSNIYVSTRDALNGEIKNLTRISNARNKVTAANGTSTEPSISADGRYVAFQSTGTDIVSSDTNAVADVFIYDSTFFTTVRCQTSGGTQGDAASLLPRLTGAGESVGFYSAATNFGASSGFANAFVGSLGKNSFGRLTSCSVALASPGTGGTGANGNVSAVGVAIVPRTVTSNNQTSRQLVTTAVYQSTGSNLTSSADANGVADIFQTPICNSTDSVTDSDGDGVVDCFDQCPEDPVKVEDTDTDTDGVPDCEDGCKNDSQKLTAGVCGCGTPDTDTDADGTPDCGDSCSSDPAKTAPGVCGCGVPDVDVNDNGTEDCLESSNPTPVPTGTATPSPTATPTFTEITPQTPDLQRSGTSALGILYFEGLPASGINHYDIQLLRTVNGLKTTTNKRLASNGKNTVTFTRLKSGTYKLRFRAVSNSSQNTKWSSYSRSVKVR